MSKPNPFAVAQKIFDLAISPLEIACPSFTNPESFAVENETVKTSTPGSLLDLWYILLLHCVQNFHLILLDASSRSSFSLSLKLIRESLWYPT